MDWRRKLIIILSGTMVFSFNCFNILIAQEPIWTDEFTNFNSRWNWNYNMGTGYKKLITIDSVSALEIGITDQSSSSSYSDSSLHETSQQHVYGIFEARLRCTDDNGFSQPWQGTVGWGFWYWDNDPSKYQAAWFWSASSESDASLAYFQVMVARDATIFFQKSLPEIYIREWHVYRVELLPKGTRFLVDNNEIAFTPQRPDRLQQINIWIDNFYAHIVDGKVQAAGYLNVQQDQKIYIDWIKYYDYYNRPPVLDPIRNKSVNEGELLEFTITASDVDRDDLTYSATNLPEGATFDPESQVFSWTPDWQGSGEYKDIVFSVSDGTDYDEEIITINVIGKIPLKAPTGLKIIQIE